MCLNALALALGYPVLIYCVKVHLFFHLFGVAIYLSWVITEIIILSQHTHIPQKKAGEKDVRPYRYEEQPIFTRSLRFPRWFSKIVLLNFDAHELHHAFPTIPGYDLSKFPYDAANEISWWSFVWRSRLMRADVFLYQDRNDTGQDL